MWVAAFGRLGEKLHQSRPAIWRLVLNYHCAQLGERVLHKMPYERNIFYLNGFALIMLQTHLHNL